MSLKVPALTEKALNLVFIILLSNYNGEIKNNGVIHYIHGDIVLFFVHFVCNLCLIGQSGHYPIILSSSLHPIVCKICLTA